MRRATATRCALAAAVHAALAGGVPHAAEAARWDFNPYAEVSAGYIHNIELNPNNLPHSDDWVGAAEAGLTANYSGQRLLGAARYSWRGVNYLQQNQWDSSYNNLAASGRAIAVQNLFYVDANVFYRQALIDPAGSPNLGGYFQPGNIQDSWGWSVRPVLHRDFGYTTLSAYYNYGEVNFQNESPTSQDSTNKSAYASLATSDPDVLFSWKLFYRSDRTEYTNFLPYRYDQTGAELGYAVNSSLRLIGEYGLETDLTQSASNGGLDSPYWSAGFVYEPNGRNRVEARAGERFWGDSYYFSLRHVARFLEFTALYSETPTTNAARRVAAPEGPPDQVPPPTDFPDFEDQRLEPFLLRSADLSVAAVGQLTTVRLSYGGDNREYLYTGRTQQQRLTRLSVDRDLSAHSSARVWYTRRRWTEDPGRDTLDNILSASYRRDLGRDLTGSVETAYQIRSEDDRENADGWWIGVRLRKDF